MHFHADEIASAFRLRRMQQLLAVAEADFEHARRVAAERCDEIARLSGIVESVARPVLVERALLRGREAALAQHEAADAAFVGVGVVRCGRRFVAH
jgi:hypothetical protein